MDLAEESYHTLDKQIVASSTLYWNYCLSSYLQKMPLHRLVTSLYLNSPLDEDRTTHTM